jgi:hypothetical protein
MMGVSVLLRVHGLGGNESDKTNKYIQSRVL